ncbi:hypothetical protein K2173_025624 [Erythroxylum novogranatense]|uniref:Histone deacetylase domain-containing protein n=1 Tax=Erythroxylum novogranatense TaxID=1862640 RepID=A0AAV8SNV1_9ROSI|nr:hypothetical protein K2173_025624 [Erythroxylum novogranatense]
MGEVVCREAKSSVRRVGLLYDDRMCKHRTPDGDPHPENPDRIKVIWNKLLSNNIPQRLVTRLLLRLVAFGWNLNEMEVAESSEIMRGVSCEEAEDKHLLTVHSGNHVNLIRSISSIKSDSRRERIASKWNSIYLNEGSSEAAYLAVGSIVENEIGLTRYGV